MNGHLAIMVRRACAAIVLGVMYMWMSGLSVLVCGVSLALPLISQMCMCVYTPVRRGVYAAGV